MSCTHDRTELVAFHLGELTLDERDTVEARLLACTACLAELFAVKRAIETAEDAPRPSDVVRERLRRAVAKVIRQPAPRRWWERPAAVAFAASLMIASIMATQAITSGPGAAPHGLRAAVD